MSITTYAELKTAIGNWLDRSDLTSYTSDFIAIAEAIIFDELRIKEMVQRQTTTASTSERYLALPDRFIKMERLQFNTSPVSRLEFLPNHNLLRHIESGSGKPSYYTITGNELEFNMVCDSAYTVEMTFYQRPQALSDSNTTNDILTNYPNIYLYGALVQAEPFLKNDERLTTWLAMYSAALESANRASNESKYSGPLRARP